MNKELSLTQNKELCDLEKEIDNLDEIKDWSQKIKKMKELKELIDDQRKKINGLIEIINSGEVKKMKRKKESNLDDLLKDFETCQNIDEKVKLYNIIQSIIRDTELELFDE